MFEGLIADRTPAEIPDRHIDVSAPVIDKNLGLGSESTDMPVQDKGGWGLSDALAGSTREAQMTPTPFDWDKQQMGKFTKSNEFGAYGADPTVGPQFNEEKFAAVQTSADVFGRAIGGVGAGFGHGFWDQLTSWKNFGQTFSSIPNLGNAYSQDQLEELNKKNQEFDNNWHIFSGQNSGMWNTIAKEFQGAGHFVGSLAELAAETALTQAVIGATFGTATPLEGLEAGKWANFAQEGLKVTEAVDNTKVTSNLWKGIGEYTSQASKVLPGIGNTVGFVGEGLQKGAVGGVMATMGRGFGSFINDLRSINTAVSFAAGNAASTYQQVISDQTEKWKKEHGGDEPGFADLQDIKDKAYKAAKVDGGINAYAMLFLEKAAFGSILNSRATLEGVVTNTERDIYGGIGKKPWYATGAEEAPLYVKQQIKWGNLRASIFNPFSEAGNYGELGKHAIAKGAEFGAFNNAMAAIDAGTKAYYEAKMDNKDISALDAIHEGVASQFTKEGGKSFISGFVQGALLLGLGGAAFDGVKGSLEQKMQQRGMTPEAKQQLETYKTDVATGQKGLVDEFNDTWNNPFNPVKETMRQMLQQQSFAEVSKQELGAGNRKDFHDIQDDATREFILKMTKNGLADMWVDKMAQYSRTLGQEDLTKMIGVENTPENYKDIQAQIAKLPARVRDIKKIHKQVEEKLQNHFDEYQKDENGKLKYTPGSIEWAAEQNNRKMYDMAKDYMVMAHDVAGQAIKRQGELLNGSRGTTGILDMPFGKNLEFTSVYAATSPELLERQVYNASEELKTATTAQAKSAAESKIKKISAYKEVLEEYLNKRAEVLDKGKGDPGALQELRKQYKEKLADKLHSYLKHTVDVRNFEGKVIEHKRPPEENEVHDAMDKFMDYYDLGQEHGRTLDTINMLMDPRLIKHFEMSFIREGVIRGQEEKTPKPEEKPPVPPTGDIPPSPEEKPGKLTQEEISRLENHESELLSYLLKQPEGQPLNLQNKAMDQVIEETGLLQQIQAAHTLFKGEERKKELTAIVKGWYDKLIDRSIEKAPKRNDLTSAPHITETGKPPRYAVDANGKQVDGTYSSIREANREMEKYIDKNHPLIPDTSIREGQKIYDTGEDEYKVVNRDGKLYIRPWKEGTRNKDIPVTTEDLKDYSTVPTAKPETGEKRFTAPKATLAVNKGVGVEAFIPDYSAFSKLSLEEQAVKRAEYDKAMAKAVISAPTEGYSITSEKNPYWSGKTFYKPVEDGTGQSTNVYQQIDEHTLFLHYNGEHVGAIDPITVYKDKSGTYLIIDQLNKADITDIYHIPTDGDKTTSEQVYNALRDSYYNALRLRDLIHGKEHIDLADDDRIQINRRYSYNWIKTGETGPKLSELEGLQQGEHGLKMYVTNSYKPDDPVIQNTTTSDDEEKEAQGVISAGQDNYYKAAVQLANGDWIPVGLTPRQIRPEEIAGFLKNISGVKDDEGKKTANTELDKLFIALPGEDMKGVSVRLFSSSISDDSHIFVRVDKKVGEDIQPLGSGNIMSHDFSTPDDLLSRLNLLLKSKAIEIDIPDITTDNLKYQSDKNNIADMEASVHKDIISKAAVTYKVKDTQGQQRAIEDIPAIATVPRETEPIQEEKPISSLKQAALDRKVKQDAINREFGVPKTVAQDFTAQHVTDIDIFHNFVKEKLPDFLSVGELTGVVHNLLDNRVTVGQFTTWIDRLGQVRGEIQTSPEAPYKYHEAFHGIFRLLTTDVQQTELYRDAPTPSSKQLIDLQKSHPRYTDMDESTLRKEWKEEWMADQFDKFSQQRDTQTTSGIKGIFNRIKNWIRYIADTLSGNRMRALFHEVHTGDFKRADLQQNSFTGKVQVDISSPVPKAIPVEVVKSTVHLDSGDKDVRVVRHLDSQTAIQLANDITAGTLLDMQQSKLPSFDKAIESTLNRYRDTYDPEHPRNIETYDTPGRFSSRGAKEDWVNRLLDMHTALSEDKARAILKENIQENLRIQGIKQRLIDEEADDVDEAGRNFYKNVSSVGGYGAMDKSLRTYIGSTNVKLSDIGKTDNFGYTTHADGTPIYQSVDTNTVYNGLLKLLSQKSDAKENLRAILSYRDSGNNLDTTSFISKWLTETGVDIDKFDNSSLIQCTNRDLFNKVIKGFSQINNDYTSVIQDPDNGRVMVVDAGKKGPESYQFSQASAAFYQNYFKDIETSTNKGDKDKMYRSAVEPLKILAKQTNTTTWKNKRIEDEPLAQLSQQISTDLMDKLGINLHLNYISFSITSGKEPSKLTPKQQQDLLLYPTAKPIDIAAMEKKGNILSTLEAHKNPFVRAEGKDATAAETWLMKTFKENATFDSSVDSMSHSNSNNDPVYNYQFPSYNTSAVRKLNTDGYIRELSADVDKKDSWLLTNPEFSGMTKQMMSVGGLDLKRAFLEKAETEDADKELQVLGKDIGKTGTDFSDFNDREYTAFNLATYDITTNSAAYHKDADGHVWYSTPISLGPIAEKSTHHAVYLPVQRAIEGGKLTDKVKDILYNEVVTEAQRIQRVRDEIAEGRKAVIDRGGKWITDYHDGQERGTKLFSTKELLPEELRNKIEAEPDKIEEHKAEIHKEVEKAILKQVADYKDMLKEQGLISADNKNILAPAYLFKGLGEVKNSQLNLKAGDLDHNLAQVYTNSYIGYLGISRLLYGDKAKVSKDTQDWWKRMAGSNAQGPSMDIPAATETQPAVTDYKLITYPTDKFTTKHGATGEADDGQAYVTPMGYRTMISGKATELHHSLIDKTEQGRDLSVKEFEAMHENSAIMNSLKPAYKDTETYLKSSVSMLNRLDTSYKVNGKWVALPGRELLHDRLESAEEQEQEHSVPVFIANKSLSKGATANLVQEGDDISKAYHDIAAEYMRLQTATPMTPDRGNKSTQPDKQILSNQDYNKDVYLDGKHQKAGLAVKQYIDSNRQRVLNNFLTAVNAFSDKPISSLKDLDKINFDMAKFQDAALDTLKATGMDAQTIELFADHYNINLPPLVEKSTQTFLSNLIKEVTKEKVPMWKMTLRSDSGMSVIRKVISLTEDGQPKTWEIVPMDSFKKNPSAYDVKSMSSGMYNKSNDKWSGIKVGDHISDRLRDNIPMYDDKGKLLHYYSEGMRPYMTVDEKKAGQFSEALNHGFGARTPGTGFQSYRRVHWVDRLSDVLGNTAILSRDVMTATGHDYDVDSLFTAIPDTYMDGGVRKAYGTAISEPEKFYEYKQWLLDNNRQVKQLYHGDKLYSTVEVGTTLLGDSTTNLRDVTNDYRITEVLKELQLPATLKEFKEKGGAETLNNGVLTNKALDAQLALLSGEHVSGGGEQARINRATSTKPVEDFIQKLADRLTEGESSERAKEVADRLMGKTGDLNGLLGQTEAYTKLQQGGEGIGGVANMIQATAVLNQFDKKLDRGISYGGQVYDEYKGKKGTSEVERDQNADIIAQLHVDAPKNSLPSKLNLSQEFATVLTHAVKLGLPMDSAMLYPQTKVWEDYNKQVAYGTRAFKTGPQVSADITLNRMIGQLSDVGAKRVELNDDNLIDYIKGGKTDVDMDYTLLSDLKNMRDLTEPLKYLSRFMRFDTGSRLSSWEDIDHVKEGLKGLGVGLTDEEFHNSGIPVDLRDVITKRHGNLSANYKVLQHLDTLGKKAFVDQSELFKDIQTQVISNLDIPDWDNQFHTTLKHDIRSYLSISALKTMLEQKGRKESLDTMNNNLIWDNQDSSKSIIHILTDLRGKLGDNKEKNYALNNFLNTVLKGKGTDINQVIANTWTKMNDQQQQKVVGAISDLVSDKRGDIHQGGLALFNYLLVKDGGQYKNNSFIRFIPPHMMREWSDVMGKITGALSGTLNDQQAIDIFGKTKQRLSADFVHAYMTHTDNQNYVPQLADILKKGGDAPLPDYYRDYGKLHRYDPDADKHVHIPVDGDSKQWKGAKAVFGDYPKSTEQAKADTGRTQQITDNKPVIAALKEHGISAGINDKGQWIYTIPEGGVTGPSPEDMLQRAGGEKPVDKPTTSEQPVVTSQQIEWNKEIDIIMKSKQLPEEHKEQWLSDARDMYRSLQGKMGDNDILDKLKTCL